MIAAVVLAAGTSSRLGVPKQMLEYQGRSVLALVVKNLLETSVGRVVVVLGHRAEELAGILEGYPVEKVVNGRYAEGQSTSVKAGLAALGGSAEAIIFVLGDQPLVKPRTVRLLIERYSLSGGIVAPYYRGQRGNPVLFSRRFFSEIEALKGDAGAREIIGRHPESLSRVDVDDPGVLFDIDTWEDYRKLIGQDMGNME